MLSSQNACCTNMKDLNSGAQNIKKHVGHACNLSAGGRGSLIWGLAVQPV